MAICAIFPMEELSARILYCTRTSILPSTMGENGGPLAQDSGSGQPGIDLHKSRTGKRHVLEKQPLLGTPLPTNTLSPSSGYQLNRLLSVCES